MPKPNKLITSENIHKKTKPIPIDTYRQYFPDIGYVVNKTLNVRKDITIFQALRKGMNLIRWWYY